MTYLGVRANNALERLVSVKVDGALIEELQPWKNYTVEKGLDYLRRQDKDKRGYILAHVFNCGAHTINVINDFLDPPLADQKPKGHRLACRCLVKAYKAQTEELKNTKRRLANVAARLGHLQQFAGRGT